MRRRPQAPSHRGLTIISTARHQSDVVTESAMNLSRLIPAPWRRMVLPSQGSTQCHFTARDIAVKARLVGRKLSRNVFTGSVTTIQSVVLRKKMSSPFHISGSITNCRAELS